VATPDSRTTPSLEIQDPSAISRTMATPTSCRQTKPKTGTVVTAGTLEVHKGCIQLKINSTTNSSIHQLTNSMITQHPIAAQIISTLLNLETKLSSRTIIEVIRVTGSTRKLIPEQSLEQFLFRIQLATILHFRDLKNTVKLKLMASHLE
jgi:hypothetical protein